MVLADYSCEEADREVEGWLPTGKSMKASENFCTRAYLWRRMTEKMSGAYFFGSTALDMCQRRRSG